MLIADGYSSADTIYCIVWIKITERKYTIDFTVIKCKRHPFTAAEKVILADAGLDNQSLGLGISKTGHEITEWFFLN